MVGVLPHGCRQAFSLHCSSEVTNLSAAANMSSIFLAAPGHPAFRRASSVEQQLKGCRRCGSFGGDVFICGEWPRTVIGTKNSGFGVGKADLSGTEVYILGLGCQKDLRTVVALSCKRKKSHFLARYGFRYGKRAQNSGSGKWRSEFSGATEERGSTDFESRHAPANFVCNSQQQGIHSGNFKHEVRGQQDDFTAVTLAGIGVVVSPELLHGARAKVVAVGAGASAIVSFCQQSALLPSAQFWYSADVASEPVLRSDIYLSDSARNGLGLILRLCTGLDIRVTEFANLTPVPEDAGKKGPVITRGSNKGTVFLVLGVGSGTGLGTVPDQLKVIRSRGCLAVAIFIKPFMFEGPKRLEQANQLIDSLLGCTDMLLVVEQDGLLRRDIVTVSEASILAKNACLLSITTIAELLAERADVLLDAKIEGNLTCGDIMKILRHAGKTWLGSGKGKTCKEAIEMAVAEAPISDYRPFEAKRLVLCSVASAMDQSTEDVEAWKSFLHETLGPELQLVVRAIKNPVLENDVKLAAIIIARVNNAQVTRQISDKSGGEYGVPSMIGINTIDQNDGSKQSPYSSFTSTSKSTSFSPSESSQEKTSPLLAAASIAPNDAVLDNGSSSVKVRSVGGTKISKRPLPHRALGKRPAGHTYRWITRDNGKNSGARQVLSQELVSSTASTPSQKLRLAWEAGPSSDIAEAWAQARAEAREPAQVTSPLDISLSMGVRLDTITSENFLFATGIEVAEEKRSGTDAVPVDSDTFPKSRMMDKGLEAVRDMYNAASALVMGRDMTDERRQAPLSQRAASMLEGERSQKKLTPLVEIGFKNGTYKGRCQGGFPEGQGRLSFSDGSFYDGQWRQGKRAGYGAFYYSNGDMFQGSWEDDVMHGKGWMYYHNGDRLHANFWKGRADGEGRFYSAQGDVFSGQFRENWRHGEFLYMKASGVRWSEIWENGVLLSRTLAKG